MLDKHPPIKTEKQIKNYLYLEYFKKLGNIHPTATAPASPNNVDITDFLKKWTLCLLNSNNSS